uniref:Putative site-specific DNA endonuclease n=1 Tax=Chlorokybus atmophyticus TaxID=3144 RepID=A6YED0_CHLAT|nr:putative site-specific DNA endonuclease [Chlorokybus atmophyticus]ABO15143.1 putative site-specific DNA endonuclease [Chlorokybus atmophyticus]
MDGDGSIQVNHWKKRSLQYRLVIKLKNTEVNGLMLKEISDVVGGHVRQIKGFVLWVENHKAQIQKIISIFEIYPPLTTRLQCQLIYLKRFLHCASGFPRFLIKDRKKGLPQSKGNSLFLTKTVSDKKKDNDLIRVESYLKERPFKYDNVLLLRHSMAKENLLRRSYFKEWLSGFIEAKGCFSIRKSGDSSFSISQKTDYYLLENIRNYFGAVNMVRILKEKTLPHFSTKKIDVELTKEPLQLQKEPFQPFHKVEDLFLLEVYRKESFKKIIEHCLLYPLLGEKRISFEIFVSNCKV